MSKMKQKTLRSISKAALANARKEANSACVFLGYQPKMPEKLKRLKKDKEK